LFATLDKNNAAHYKTVLRGYSHKRPRGDTGKYSSVFLVEKDGFAGGRVNFLGEEWAKR